MAKKKKQMTLKKLLQNPTGKGSAQGARRDIIKDNLHKRMLKLVEDESGNKFQYRIYQPNKNEFIFHFKIPSESIDNLYYDAVLKFIASTKSDKNAKTITDYDLEIFSNSPNFLFTYAYVVYNNNFLVDELSGKISTKAKRQPPDERNPVESYGFEKSLYFAASYIKKAKMYYINDIKSNTSSWNLNQFLKSIPNTDEKLEEYNNKKEK